MWRALNARSCSTINFYLFFKKSCSTVSVWQMSLQPGYRGPQPYLVCVRSRPRSLKNRRSTKQKQKQGQRSEPWCRNQQIGRASGCSFTVLWYFTDLCKFIQSNNLLLFTHLRSFPLRIISSILFILSSRLSSHDLNSFLYHSKPENTQFGGLST